MGGDISHSQVVRIVVVADDTRLRDDCERGLARPRYAFDHAPTGDDAVTRVAEARRAGAAFSIAFVDACLASGPGAIDTIARLWTEDPDLQVVLCGASAEVAWPALRATFGETDQLLVLKRPFDVAEVRQLVVTLSSKWRLARDARGRLEHVEQEVASRTRALQEVHVELSRRGRLEALGRLAAGMAHEINNPLTYLGVNLTTLHGYLASDQLAAAGEVTQAELNEMLDDCLMGWSRIRDVVDGMRLFSDPRQRDPRPVDVPRVLRFALKMVGGLLRDKAEVHVQLARVPGVMADEGQLGQVFLNLLLNAAAALDDTSRNHVVWIDCRQEEGRVVVDVADTGHGVAPDVAERMFDPFFTTKPVGEGTGLGLSIARGIVSGLGGTIALVDRRHATTCFRVTLPSVDDVVRAEPPRVVVQPVGKRVLVVDDDAALLRALDRALADCHVVGASDGALALELCAARRFDAIVCDVRMPSLSGTAFLERLEARDPAQAARVVFLSGAAFDPTTRAAVEATGRPLFDKPVDLAALGAAIRDISAQPLAPRA